jgi:hypothetical protein
VTAVFLPPMVVDVRVHESGGRRFRIWLPVILLWPLLLIVVGFALVVSILVDLALWVAGANYHIYTMLILRALKLLAESRGTQVHVNGHDADLVDVEIY